MSDLAAVLTQDELDTLAAYRRGAETGVMRSATPLVVLQLLGIIDRLRTAPASAQVRAALEQAVKLEHAAFHALDDCEVGAEGALISLADYEALSALLPEEHPDAYDDSEPSPFDAALSALAAPEPRAHGALLDHVRALPWVEDERHGAGLRIGLGVCFSPELTIIYRDVCAAMEGR